MPGRFCRGCGRHKDDLKVSDPRKCPRCGPLLAAKRDWCEWCGERLPARGTDVCPACTKKAGKFFGR